MAETLRLLSIISFSIAGVSLLLAFFFWFFFKIPSVIGDLTGRTARKSIAKMRAANEKTGVKSYEGSKTNAERGKLTGTIPGSSKSKDKSETTNDRPDTGILIENKAGAVETEETGKLDDKTTESLDDEDATALLNSTENEPIKRVGGIAIKMLDDVVLIHTNEVIE